MAVGDIVFFPGQIATMTASGSITKGDMVYISGAGPVVSVIPANHPEYYSVGMACEDIADTKKGPIMIFGPVVKLTGKATVTVGKPIVQSDTVRQFTDMSESALATGVEVLCPIGIAWEGVASATAEIMVQLMHVFYRDTGYAST